MRFAIVIAAVAVAFLLLISVPRVKSSLAQWGNSLSIYRTAHLVTPWKAIGGCGSSSGSIASGMQLKWIGRGVTGALFDFEAIAGLSQDFDTSGIGNVSGDGIVTGLTTNSLLLNLFYHPPNINFKVTAPLIMKHGYYQGNGYATNLLGDLSLDVNRKWGMEGALTTGITLSFPTGSTDIPQTQDNTGSLLAPPYFQMGSGMFGGSARLEYLTDQDWGFINVGASYTGSFFAMITDEYTIANANGLYPVPVSAHKVFKFSREGMGGINDAGTVIPDNVSMYVDLEKKTQSFAHGFSVSFSFPFRDGRWQQGSLDLTNMSSTNPNAEQYFPTKEQAQHYVDTARDPSDTTHTRMLYTNPVVVGTWNNGPDKQWDVEQYEWIKLRAYPSLSLQYSIEKSDEKFPVLLGGMIRFEFDQGILFAGISGGVGFKFPVY